MKVPYDIKHQLQKKIKQGRGENLALFDLVLKLKVLDTLGGGKKKAASAFLMDFIRREK